MFRYIFAYIVFYTTSVLAIEDASKIIGIDMVDLKKTTCWSQYQTVGLENVQAYRVNHSSKTHIRVILPKQLLSEGLVEIEAKIFDSKFKVTTLSKSKTILMTNQQQILTFEVPSNLLDGELIGTVVQIQVVVFTKNSEYFANSTVRLFNERDEIKGYFANQKCHYSLPAITVSELYQNRDSTRKMAIIYSPKTISEVEKTYEKLSGILDITRTIISNPNMPANLQQLGFGGSLYSVGEWKILNDKYREVEQEFTLGPSSYGYVVRQDLVEVTPVKTFSFNQCGFLVAADTETERAISVMPAYTLISLSPHEINNLELINQKLLSYNLFNTCEK